MHTPVATDDPALEKDPDRRAWLIALALSVLLHVGAIVGLSRFAHGQTTPVPIDVMSVQLVTEPASESQPKQFTELPRDRADATPKTPEFLSNVTSRARDQVPGGAADVPKAQDGDAAMVSLEPRGAQPASPKTPQPQPSTATEQNPSSTGASAVVQPSPREADDSSPDAHPGAAGNSDIHQPEIAEGGNVELSGDISLNTTAWNYAPWLDRYRRQLLREWMAPPAYEFGLLKEGGWAVIDVEITRVGKMLRCDLQDQMGHPSLILAAETAVRSVDPIEPLPADFPEPTLILRIRMIYPKIVPRIRSASGR